MSEVMVIACYRPKRGKHNDYGYDPAEQRSQTFTGMGMDINVHDNWAVESQGAIHDRAFLRVGEHREGQQRLVGLAEA